MSGGAVVASIFVNPLQFGPHEDLSRYPRDETGDLAALEAEGCALVWLPDVATMYPDGEATTVVVGGASERWEGDARPGHFRGVATVCAKLFGQVRPDRAYFGEKDWQQLQVVKRMVADLLLPLEIVGVETVREADGLAMSSRNRFLPNRGPSGGAAAVPPRCRWPRGVWRWARPPIRCLRRRASLGDAGFVVDYVALVMGRPWRRWRVRGRARLVAAALLGSVRLIDNMAV